MKQPVTYRKVRRDYLNSIDYMRKKMWRHMLVLGAIALGVILYAVFCTVHMKIQDATATRAYVHNYTQQIANMVEIDVNDTAITISSLSRAIKDNEEQGDLPVFLNQKCAVYDLDFMAVCDGDDNVEATAGNFLLSKKQMKQIREEKSFQEALNEKACAVGVLDGYVLFAVDLYEDGVKTGTFWAGNKEEKLRNIFVTKTFQKEKSGSFILNGKGDILLASSEINTYKNFSEFLKYGTILEENEKEIYKNAMEGKDRIFAFKSRLGKRFFFTCIGTDVNDWITVTVMPADLFTGFSDSYVTKMLACILAVFIIFFAFFVLLFRSYVENGEKLEKLAFCDEVTGGINRTEFRIKYQELCRKQKADQFTLVLIDCEDFKMINKSLGDKNGDRMLRYFYSIIDQSLNKEQDEFVSRTEMDHYFVLLREKHPNIVRERVEHMVKKINMFQGMDIAHFEISFWLGACPIDDNHSDLTLLQDRVRAVL